MTQGQSLSVCYYGVASHLGGAERSLLDLLIQLKRTGELSKSWVLLPKNGPLVDELVQAEIPFQVLQMPALILKTTRGAPFKSILFGILGLPAFFTYCIRLILLLRRQKPDLIHTTGLKCHFIAAFLKPFVRRPVLWHLRDILRPGVTLSLLRFTERVFKPKLVANSRATAQAYGSQAPVQNLMPFVYNGFDSKRYYSNPNSYFRDSFQVSENIPIIGIIGVLARWKGQVQFLEMAGVLTHKGRAARFVIVGDRIYDTGLDSGYEEELKTRVKELGLEGRVLFTGFLEDVNRAMNGLTVLVHASNQPEPFGRVLVEALGCGVPVVASAAGGVLEVIEHGKTGLLFPPGNVDAMVDAVSSLLDHPEDARRMAAEGRSVFLSKFSMESYAAEMGKIYKSDLITSQ
ncbi:MAG: glycosyltransferase [Bdellovibrio sp.]|nr:glycosyltransferase [Bdellovibrio sp.]